MTKPTEEEFIAMMFRYDWLYAELMNIEKCRATHQKYDVTASICHEFELEQLRGRFVELGIFKTARIIPFPSKHKVAEDHL